MDANTLHPGTARQDRRLLARRQLSVGRPDLSLRQPAAEAAADARGRQAHAARPLGHDARPELHLRPPEPGHQEVRPRHDLHLRARARRPGRRRQHLPRGHLQRDLSEHQPGRSRTAESSFMQFSFPGGIPSHASPECPGSIHEGGELGYSLSHAFGAVFDNPDLIVACVVGDGEAETGPLATAWHSNKFLNPVYRRRGAADPAPERLQDCRTRRSWRASPAKNWSSCCAATAGRRTSSKGTSPSRCIRRWPRRSTRWWSRFKQHSAGRARRRSASLRPRWPMIVLSSPKGWTGPKVVDGLQIEGTFRAHQVPLSDPRYASRTSRSCWRTG